MSALVPASAARRGGGRAVLALVIGVLSLHRLRHDYQAIVMLVVSLMATLAATNDVRLVNGPNGLSLIPKPPSLMILDEPSANLAPELAKAVLNDQARKLAQTGVGVLLVKQKVFEALAVSDWALVLVAGRLRMEGPPAELLNRADLRDVFLGADDAAPAAPAPPRPETGPAPGSE